MKEEVGEGGWVDEGGVGWVKEGWEGEGGVGG